MEQDFIDISNAVKKEFERIKDLFGERLASSEVNAESYFDTQAKRLQENRHGKEPLKDFDFNLSYSAMINKAGQGNHFKHYYSKGWDWVEHGTLSKVPKHLVIDGWPETIIKGAADALFYCWLKKERNIKAVQIESNVEGQDKKKPLLQWNAGKNILATIFYDLIDTGAITYVGNKTNGGVKSEIARMLKANFIDNEGKPFDEQYVNKVLKPQSSEEENNTGKSKYRIDKDKLKRYIKKNEES